MNRPGPNRHILPPKLLKGLREILETGMEPQELADRLGPLIDVIAQDIRHEKIAKEIRDDSCFSTQDKMDANR